MFADDIYRLLTYNDSTCRMFKGVFAVNEVPPLENKSFVVCNTQRRSQPGEHWVLLFKNNDRTTYFDSFGLAPIELPLRKIHIDEFNDKCIQSLYSPFCGCYCTYVAYMLCNGAPLSVCVSPFGSNLCENDLIVVNKMEEAFIA